ncbi:6130_t:CDS:2 [Racocetra fulgida]|uniref:6130_t:CDS:1 n=1 Tax=Racocetra fulgida TaxID=60492 RepID=A0A9N9F9Z0_9GLOM|nr:6130_t:CDS:2 [Racocetra fulgida]
MQQDLNTPFKKFVASIGGRMEISPNPEIVTPDFEIYQKLLLGVYKNEKFKEVRKIYDDLQLRKETAKKKYREDLISIGEQKAKKNYDQMIEKINQDNATTQNIFFSNLEEDLNKKLDNEIEQLTTSFRDIVKESGFYAYARIPNRDNDNEYRNALDEYVCELRAANILNDAVSEAIWEMECVLGGSQVRNGNGVM